MDPKLDQSAKMAGHGVTRESNLRCGPTADNFLALPAVDKQDHPILELYGSQVDAAGRLDDSRQKQAGIDCGGGVGHRNGVNGDGIFALLERGARRLGNLTRPISICATASAQR